jgi:NAD(P)-dependent dehydrogenase (short-subunit alcohol dehydrogenase family)
MCERVWLVTGGSRGLGRAFVEAALDAGDRVAATVRDVSAAADLVERYGDRTLIVPLDVAHRGDVFGAFAAVTDQFGRIDVLVNNAGYVLSGGVEEVSEDDVRRQYDVNLFGALWCTQAVLPVMRRQRSGHIFQISTVGAVTAPTNLGLYCSTKWALEGVSEALAQEVAGLGVRITIVELSAFRSDWNGTSMTRATPMSEYDEILGPRREVHSGIRANTGPGDPMKAAAALLHVLEDDDPPLRLLLGNQAVDHAMLTFHERLRECGRWEALSRSADFDH